MLTFELTARIDAEGNLHLPSNCKPAFGKQARVIVQIDDGRPANDSPPVPNFTELVGVLAQSPNLNGDPVAIQRELRAGGALKLPDAIILATAQVHGLRLLTLDQRLQQAASNPGSADSSAT